MPDQLENPRRFFQFSSTLFIIDQPDDQIDWWFPGADCAGWFYARLLPLPGVKYGAAPFMEDWGWQFEIKVDGTTLVVNVRAADQWFFEVELPKPGWFAKPAAGGVQARERLCDAIEAIARQDDRFTVGGWHPDMP
jgi:hypothetical protein